MQVEYRASDGKEGLRACGAVPEVKGKQLKKKGVLGEKSRERIVLIHPTCVQ